MCNRNWRSGGGERVTGTLCEGKKKKTTFNQIKQKGLREKEYIYVSKSKFLIFNLAVKSPSVENRDSNCCKGGEKRISVLSPEFE